MKKGERKKSIRRVETASKRGIKIEDAGGNETGRVIKVKSEDEREKICSSER